MSTLVDTLFTLTKVLISYNVLDKKRTRIINLVISLVEKPLKESKLTNYRSIKVKVHIGIINSMVHEVSL